MTHHDPDQNVDWAQDLQGDAMVAAVGEEDFTQYLDLDDDFQQFTTLNNNRSGLDTPMGQLGFGNSATDLTYTTAEQMAMHVTAVNEAVAFHNPMPTHQVYGQFPQYQQMQMPPHYHVPPTPVSAEMHPGKYAQQMGNNGQILFNHQQVSFTPLVSPAQTPLDNTFSMTDYGVADEFFSPLTSPAIEAQTAYSSTGTTASPIDRDDASTSGNPAVAGTKRPRKKTTNAARTSARSVKQSPAMKPLTRRRHASLTSLPMEKITTMLPQGASGSLLLPSAPNSAVLPGTDASVSPEPSSDAAMRPPPVPSSGRSTQGSSSKDNNPVTPAVLMRMPSNQEQSGRAERLGMGALMDEPMEDIMLPDAAAATSLRPSHTVIEARTPESGDNTPVLSAKTPKMSAASTPRGSLAQGSSQDNFAKPSKLDSRGGRASKKRQSVSSAAISPALRPKISPSISPLAPAAGSGMPNLTAENSALYLASKSNYQNILEGTHLPGVSYPETLAENLTSKRTSHKIAEQGRRNRINLALKEIETMLPASILLANSKKEKAMKEENDDGDSAGKGAAGGQGASKASTVEMAITYIKSLEAQLKDTQQNLITANKQLAELRSRDSSADTQPTPEEA